MKIDISSIISKFASLDSSGQSAQKIDTFLEYYKLGEYLNGSLNDNELTCKYDDLDDSQKQSILKIYKKAEKFLTKSVFKKNNHIKITDDNLDEYLSVWRNIDDSNTISEFDEQFIDELLKGLYDYCIVSGYDLSDLEYNNIDYDYVLSTIKRRNRLEAEMVKKGQVVIDRLEHPYDTNLLRDAVNKRILDENIPNLDRDKYSSDLGNGKYDKPATQETELCWAHAGINVLLLTEEGRSLLNANKYYDESTGVFAIHLQEAEDNGLHGGIYIITPEEIEQEGQSLSSGEGDVTVWMIAIKRYFEEMKNNPELMELAENKGQIIRDVEAGNYQTIFFELITGAQSSRKDLYDFTRLQTGISYGRQDIIFEDIEDLVSNQKGAVVLCIGGHAFSVVGVKGDKLLIQESNNSEYLNEEYIDKARQHAIFTKTKPVNNRPTYELSKFDLEHYDFGEAAIKWK